MIAIKDKYHHFTITRKQREALYRLWMRENGKQYFYPNAYRRVFRTKVSIYPDGSGCIMVPYCNMFVGIETDGHAHS